jgi:hypothetical protein
MSARQTRHVIAGLERRKTDHTTVTHEVFLTELRQLLYAAGCSFGVHNCVSWLSNSCIKTTKEFVVLRRNLTKK